MSDQETSTTSVAKFLVYTIPTILAVAGLIYAFFGYQDGQLFEDLRNLVGAGHHCPIGEHWSTTLKQCFSN